MPTRAPHPLNALSQAAITSRVPSPFATALRDRDPATRHTITVAGHPVRITTTPGPAPTPERIVAAWAELRAVITALHAQTRGDCDHLIHPGMPPEIAVAIWDRGGHRVYACGPDAATVVRHQTRAARRLRRLRSLSPLPLIAGAAEKLTAACAVCTQALAGGATAAGLAIIPPLPAHDADALSTPPATPLATSVVELGGPSDPSLPCTPTSPITVPLPRAATPKPTPTYTAMLPLSEPTPTASPASPSPSSTGTRQPTVTPTAKPTDTPTAGTSPAPDASPTPSRTRGRHDHHRYDRHDRHGKHRHDNVKQGPRRWGGRR